MSSTIATAGSQRPGSPDIIRTVARRSDACPRSVAEAQLQREDRHMFSAPPWLILALCQRLIVAEVGRSLASTRPETLGVKRLLVPLVGGGISTQIMPRPLKPVW